VRLFACEQHHTNHDLPVDIFGDRSASAIAALLPLRYIVRTFLPVASPYMDSKLGYGWSYSLLALLLFIPVPPTFVMIIWPRDTKATMTVEKSIGEFSSLGFIGIWRHLGSLALVLPDRGDDMLYVRKRSCSGSTQASFDLTTTIFLPSDSDHERPNAKRQLRFSTST
jgi:hypothetical protein